MWEKIWLALAVTLSLHIFAEINLSDVKWPFTFLSPVIKAERKMPNESFVEKNFPFLNLTNIKVLINR